MPNRHRRRRWFAMLMEELRHALRQVVNRRASGQVRTGEYIGVRETLLRLGRLPQTRQ